MKSWILLFPAFILGVGAGVFTEQRHLARCESPPAEESGVSIPADVWHFYHSGCVITFSNDKYYLQCSGYGTKT